MRLQLLLVTLYMLDSPLQKTGHRSRPYRAAEEFHYLLKSQATLIKDALRYRLGSSQSQISGIQGDIESHLDGLVNGTMADASSLPPMIDMKITDGSLYKRFRARDRQGART